MSREKYNILRIAKNYMNDMLEHRLEVLAHARDNKEDFEILSRCVNDLIKTIQVIDYYQDIEADCL